MYRIVWHALTPIRHLAYWLLKKLMRLCILIVFVVVLYFLLFSGKAGAQEPAFNFGKQVSLAEGFRPIKVPGGWDKSCSQYVIASLLSALGTKIDKELYDDIGQAVNPNQTGAYRWDFESYLRTCFDFEKRMPATLADIASHLDRGLPVLASVSCSASWHLVIVVGYSATPTGEIKHLEIADNGVVRGSYSAAEFSEMWTNALEPQFNNYLLLISPSDKTPAPRPLVLVDNLQPIPETSVASTNVVEEALANIDAFRKKHFGDLEVEVSTEQPESKSTAVAEKFHRLFEEIVLKPVAAIRDAAIPNPVKELRDLADTVVFVTRVVVCVVIALGLLFVCRFCFVRNHGPSTVPKYLT